MAILRYDVNSEAKETPYPSGRAGERRSRPHFRWARWDIRLAIGG